MPICSAFDAWTTMVPSMASADSPVPISDTSYIYLQREDGSLIRRLYWEHTFLNVWTNLQWEIIDLRGQTIRILLGLYSDGDGYPSRIFVDKIEVK